MAFDFYNERTDLLNISNLENGMPGITPKMGACLAEAAIFCLVSKDHKQGVLLRLDGECHHNLKLKWRESENADQCKRTWNDVEVATEYGAYGLAALLIAELTDYTVVERSKKGTGFDYWLGKKDAEGQLFQDKARLEVSGIRSGTENEILTRVKRKEGQIKRSNGIFPGVIAVVEFSSPRTRFKYR